MNLLRLIGAVFVVAAVGGVGADELEKQYPLLAALRVPASELPEGCKEMEVPADVEELKGLKNCAITTEPKFFVIVDEPLRDLIDVKAVKAAYFGMYQEKNKECGIMGWRFASEDAAGKAHQAMAEHYANDPRRYRFWQKGEHVIWLWRDPPISDACFQHFEQVLTAKLGAPSPAKE